MPAREESEVPGKLGSLFTWGWGAEKEGFVLKENAEVPGCEAE